MSEAVGVGNVDRSGGAARKVFRRSNRELMLEVLLTDGPMHRAELARRANVSRTTASIVVTELLERGLVVETDESAENADGRAKESLVVNPAAALIVGMDFTFDRVWVHIGDLGWNEVGSEGATVDIGLSWLDRIDVAMEILHKLLAERGLEPSLILGAGIGVPGPVDRATGHVGVSLPGQPWSHVHAAEEFQRRLGVPVWIENSTRLEAIAEARWGAGQGVDTLLYVCLSSGIGSGLIVNGRPFSGAVGAAGELGHVSVDINGPACACGNRGCLVLSAGIPAVLNALRPHLGPDAVIGDVLSRCAAGDRACAGVLADVGQVAGQVLAGLCNLLNPGRIVVGGELAAAGDVLLDPMRAAIRRYALSLVRDVDVVPSGLDLGVRAGAVGGVALVHGDTANLVAMLAN
ncbi:putative NBD/HSP70 family sugar kinase [Catenulispora sp. MAP5-51]